MRNVSSTERVLLVGNDIRRLFDLRGVLDDCPAQVVMTPSLDSAKGLLRRCRFAVVAVDIEALGGGDALAALRKDGFPPEVGVLYVVDDVDGETRDSAIKDTDFVGRGSVREIIMGRLGSMDNVIRELERPHESQPGNGLALHEFNGGNAGTGRALRQSLNLEKAAGMLEGLGDRLNRRDRETLASVVDVVNNASHLMDSMAKFIAVAVADAPLLTMVDCDEVVRDVVDRLKGEIEATSAKVTWLRLPKLLTDRKTLQRVFANLIGNALKHRSGNPPVVHIDASFDEQQWTFSVADNGVGIHPAHRDLIFRPFWWNSPNAPPGAGLGLAINRMELEVLGGRIWVEPREGKGSVFRFTLPGTSGSQEGFSDGNGSRQSAA